MYSILFARFPTVDYITDHKGKTGRKGGPTLVSFTQKDETMQNTKNPKKNVRLTLIDTLMCPKT